MILKSNLQFQYLQNYLIAYKILLNFKTFVSNPVLKVGIKSNHIVNLQNNPLNSNEANLELKSPNQFSDNQQLRLLRALLQHISVYLLLEAI
ncbi:unnamed protein product [Paramecium sonneborni]|uniref:Uncharacterized protein n=1 Tax=Paramecium sonneborni TaxID=65129 RepID=A0A8S1RRX1_9CILI|nr:unnamed protein product [Paramecium sonneborni]